MDKILIISLEKFITFTISTFGKCGFFQVFNIFDINLNISNLKLTELMQNYYDKNICNSITLNISYQISKMKSFNPHSNSSIVGFIQ